MARRRNGTLARAGRRSAVTASALAIAVVVGAASPASVAPALPASAAGPVPSTPALPAPAVRSERLARFIATPGPMDLRGDRGEGGLWFNLSTRVEPTGATLHLELSNSQALVAPRSQLAIRLNDAVVAQIGLRPGTPLTVADIDLPPELLRGGSNHLSFTAAQHYTNDCENPAAAELWSQVDTWRSRLTVAARPVSVSPHLSDLPDLVGPGFFGGRRFTLMTVQPDGRSPDGSTLDDDTLATGAAVSEALGLRLRYEAPGIAYAEAHPARDSDDRLLRLQAPPDAGSGEGAGDLVLFGTGRTLAPVLGPDLARTVGAARGGFLGVYSLPADRNRLVLIVSGATGADVARAASALGVADFPFVDAAEQTVDALDVRPGGGPTLPEGGTVSLADLGLATTTLRGPAGSASFDVSVPADWYVPDSADAELSLDFAYGAGLRSDSAVNLLLNGQFLQALALQDPNGAVLRGYKVRFPARKLHPGRNTVSFETVLTPSVSGACTAPQTRNLVLSVSGSSTLALPRGDRLAAQPDLRLFAATGFPYVNGGAPFDVAVAARDPATAGAAWTMLARLAQLAKRVLPEARMVAGTPEPGRNAIVVGAVPDLPPELLMGAPVAVGDAGSLPYAATVPLPVASPVSWTRTVLELFSPSARADDASGTSLPGVSRVGGRAELGRNGLVTAFRAPGPGDHTVTVLTAQNRQELWEAAEAAVTPAVWTRLDADVAVWRPGSGTVSTERAGPVFHVGSRNTLYAARYYVGQYPFVWIGGLLGSVLVLAGTLRLFLARRLRRRFPGSTEGIP